MCVQAGDSMRHEGQWLNSTEEVDVLEGFSQSIMVNNKCDKEEKKDIRVSIR